jgi:hypothetical protein
MTTHHRITTSAIVALALAAGASPASAKFFNVNPNGSYVAVNPHATNPTPSGNTPTTIVRIAAPDSGFDWGDAGIGAAGGLALTLIGVGGAFAVSGHRARRTSRSVTRTS